MGTLEHVNMVSSNVDLTVEFLLTAMPEWYIRGEGTSAKCLRWLHIGDSETYIAIEDRGIGEKSNHITYHHTGVNHIGIVVENIEEVISRMRAKGYKEGMHSLDHPSRLRYYFFDHDDVEYEFVSYHEGMDKNDYSE